MEQQATENNWVGAEGSILSASGDTGRPVPPRASWWFHWPAQFISYVFHPLFIPSYVTAFLLYVYPEFFSGYDPTQRIRILLSIFINLSFFPAFVVLISKLLGFVRSIHLRTQKERIIPYAAALIFYFWAWYVLTNQPDKPEIFVQFIQGAFFGVCGAWLGNIVAKVSMHTIGVGGMATFFLLLSFQGDPGLGLYLFLAVMIAGITGTARMLVSDHTRFEIYFGYLLGILSQLIAAVI